MITLESQPEGLFRNPSLKADTYLDEATNLLYCKKCRTPRQKRIEVCGRIFTPLCLCDCLSWRRRMWSIGRKTRGRERGCCFGAT